MTRSMAVLVTLLLLPAFVARAGDAGYVWGTPVPEQVEILKLTGDPTRGEEAFRVCRGCHKPDAAGVADGTYPRLSGQHAKVIIKQVAEVRAGVRSNPKMKPFASAHAISTQEIADLAVFLASVQATTPNGKGPGDALARGQALYEQRGCVNCHGAEGQGDGDKFFPAVAAQHYGYLVRELGFIQKGTRGNSHPEMVEALRRFSAADLRAVADYLSRLPDHRGPKPPK